jgi:hypothetical protein
MTQMKKRKQQKRPILKMEPQIDEARLAPFLESVLDPKFQVFPWDSPKEYSHLRFRLIDQLKPLGTVETLLVEQIVSGTCRLNRSYAIEKGILMSPNVLIAEKRARCYSAELCFPYDLTDQRSEKELEGRQPPNAEGIIKYLYRTSSIDQGLAFMTCGAGDPLPRLQQYQTGLENSIYRALHELQRLQAARSTPTLDLRFSDVDDELKRRRLGKSAGQSHAPRKPAVYGRSQGSGKRSKNRGSRKVADPGRPQAPDEANDLKGKQCLLNPPTNPDVPGTATGRQA